MVRKSRSKGAGLSERKSSPLDFKASSLLEIKAFFENVNRNTQRPWRWQAELIEAARAQYLEDRKRAPSIHDDLEAYNLFYKERVTEEWYVKSIAHGANRVEKSIEKGDVWFAIEEAMFLGELVSEVRLKFGTPWERWALQGKASNEGAQDGGAMRAAQYVSKHESIREAYAQALERLNGDIFRAKETTAKSAGITRRHLNRILAKK